MSQLRHYQAILLEVVHAGGPDALLALSVIVRWEFEYLLELDGYANPRR